MKNRYNYFIFSILIIFLFSCFFSTSLCDNALSAEENYNKGQELINEKKYEKATQLNPEDKFSHYGLGYSLDKDGFYEEGIKAYKKAIRVNKNYISAYNNLGLVYYELGDKDAAMKEYEILKELNASLAE